MKNDLQGFALLLKTHTLFDVKKNDSHVLITDVGDMSKTRNGQFRCLVCYGYISRGFENYEILKKDYIKFSFDEHPNTRYELVNLSYDLLSFKREYKKYQNFNTQIDVLMEYTSSELYEQYTRSREPFLAILESYSAQVKRYNEIIREIHEQAKK